MFYTLHDRLPTFVSDFHESIAKTLSHHPDIKARILTEYAIGEENSRENLQHILEFAHDIGFYAPVVTIAQSWPGKAYVYHLNEVNPWEGQWKGFSTHILDVALLFRNYQHALPEQVRQIGDKFAEDILKYVWGNEPFPVWDENNKGARIYGRGTEGTRFIRSEQSEDYGRRSKIFELSKDIGLDKLSLAWETFIAGR